MIRTLIGVVLAIATVLWLPFWFQVVFFVVAVLILPYRLFLLIPAIVADAVYAPVHTLAHLKMTFLVAAMLIIWYVIVTQTRLTHHVSHSS